MESYALCFDQSQANRRRDRGSHQGADEIAGRCHQDGLPRRRIRVATTVAIAFAVSLKPLTYSKSSPSRITLNTRIIADAFCLELVSKAGSQSREVRRQPAAQVGSQEFSRTI